MNAEVDVLICAYNEVPNIPRVLESLRAQTVGGESFRTILVDNASTDETRRVVEENAHGLHLEYVYEGRQGKNWACNAGYARSQAAYVAHIDADAKADSRWIENILRVIRQEQPDLCGGPYFPYYTTSKPAWFLDRYNADGKGDVPRYLQEHEFLNGTNMIWCRSVVEHLGGFNPHVGLSARGLTRGDETNLMLHARSELPNFKAFYDPGIAVYHLTRPETFSLWYWMRRSFAQGWYDYGVWDKSAVRRARLLRLAQFGAEAIVVGARGIKALVWRSRREFPYWENYLYEQTVPDVYRLGNIWAVVCRPS